MDTAQQINHISLCSGYGGIDHFMRPYSPKQLADAYQQGMTITELSKHFKVGRKIIQTDCKRFGIKMRPAAVRNQLGLNNSFWRGGVTKQGHYRYIRDKTHPNATKSGYVAEHIVIALKAAGKDRLADGECVHHINMDKADNRSENLSIQTRSSHAKHHEQLQHFAINLLFKKGIISYDSQKGYYLCG